ncbi:MAG: methyltransferase domain-containing protein [Acidobacteria bacterium]|nr:methyltransferase domain-containing protein [Acidobacteriota bacterium]
MKMRSCLLFVLLAGWAHAQVAVEANKDYQTAEGRARIAKTLEDPHRAERMKPKEMVAALEIQPGGTVADVGTGVGAMLEYLVEAVGPSGRVIAEDIAQDFLDKAKTRIEANKWANVTTVLGTEKTTNLPAGEVDLVFILDAYHHFNYPAEMLGSIARGLKKDGRLALADFYRSRRGAQDKDMSKHVRADRDEVIKEVEDNGFKLLSYKDQGTSQYLLLFRKK